MLNQEFGKMHEPQSFLVNCEIRESQGIKTSSFSSRNIMGPIGCQFFNSTSVGSVESKETMVLDAESKKQNLKEKSEEQEKQVEKSSHSLKKPSKNYFLHVRIKELNQNAIQVDRDLRRFKAKYNSSVGNILLFMNWMSLIYCILVLRMNLIQLILKNLLGNGQEDNNLQKQILMESKIMYNMIRTAQNSSQEKFLYLWRQVEKLIFNRKLFKNRLHMLQSKDVWSKDWKKAKAKLMELQREFDIMNEKYTAIEQSKLDSEVTTRETMTYLEELSVSKEVEYNELAEKLREMKKKEVQTRGRILINMKKYKDLVAKKEKLISVEERMEKLKNEQAALTVQYNMKIQSLKKEIEESDQQIREEKEEQKRIKARLEQEFGDNVQKIKCPLQSSVA